MHSSEISAADLADTGLWRLIVNISASSVQAWLKNLADKEMPPVQLFSSRFADDNAAGVLSYIENAVYDHPRVLDDFSADIIMETEKTLWFPDDIAEDNTAASSLFNQVYTADADDIFRDEFSDCSALYFLCPGLNGFIQRTFPGCRIHSHQGVIFDRYSRETDENPAIYVDIHQRLTTFMAFNANSLLFALSRPSLSDNEIVYTIFNAIQTYSLPAPETHIFMTGDKQRRMNISSMLRQSVGIVMPTSLPAYAKDADMTLADVICAERKPLKMSV